MNNIAVKFYFAAQKNIHTKVEKTTAAYLQLHGAVLLFGFTAILGDLIDMSAILLVWWRVVLTSLSLLLFINKGETLRQLSTRQIMRFVGIGFLIAIHWILFYGSIKLANASVALICAATVAFFTSLIEPLINRRKVDPLELMLGFLVIPGMWIVASTVDLSLMLGFWVGLLSAFVAAIFSILNKKYIDDADPYTINFIEMTAAVAIISVLIPIVGTYTDLGPLVPPRAIDWVYLLVLAIVCTTFTNVITLKSLKHLSAFASNLVFNFEPLYGIILAAVLLKEYEQLTPQFYIGGAFIIALVLLYPTLKKKLTLAS